MKRILLAKSHVFRSLSAWFTGGVKKATSLTIFTAVLAVFLMPFPQLVVSAAQSEWNAQEVVRSHKSIKMKPGSALTFEIHFKNMGNTTWKNTGSSFVALATVDPEKRSSVFRHSLWPDEIYRPAYLLQEQVKPGEIGFFRFPLQAPDKEGEYKEVFQAVAKNAAWLEGTKFTIPITVTANPEGPKQVEVPTTTQTTSETSKVESDADYVIKQDYPVRDTSYSAQWLGGNKINLSAIGGETIVQKLQVKNTGTKTWTSSGSRYLSAYTVRPNYHQSDFYTAGGSWVDATQIKMKSETIKPGEIAEFEITLKIPTTFASYNEQIRLAVENYSWVKEGELHIQIDSRPKDQPTITTPVNKPVVESNNQPQTGTTIFKDTNYKAQFLISGGSVELKPGETATYRVGFKNTGTTTWNSSGNRFISLYTIEPSYRESRFASGSAGLNSGWIAKNQVKMQGTGIAPGQLAFFDFSLTAPATPGNYTEKFRLAAEDLTWVQGGELSISISVAQTTTLPVITNPQTGQLGNLGPIMRVGVISSDQIFSITADSPFEVQTGSGTTLVSLPAKTEVNISYNQATRQYSLQSAAFSTTSAEYMVVKALDHFTIMELLSLERRLPWNPAVNENLFRGSLEIRHSDATNKTWVINILPMEQYLKGIAETSSESPVEFLKVMSVAARTYASYHYERQTKHADEHFYVDSQFDQVYKGYALEKRHPRLVEAVDATTGEVVTWTDPQTGETKIAITPYFSSSDGRTRSWSEVWGGEVAWAKSVPVPHDIGKALLGHGVGMSARGGLLMVVEDNATYDEVLKYFFTGINIEDRY